MKVSVAITTYNHEKYIAKALDSVLMQKTNFDYEIVIGEDCSPDNTRKILIDYRKRYPDKFKLLLNEKNLGALNFRKTFQSCIGEYLAILDGDDYWTSPYKLQRQVDLLDRHPECSACYHDSLIIHEDGSKEPTSYRPSQKEFSGVEDLLLDNFIPTSSVMFRRKLYGKVPKWISTLKMGDWPIHILNAHHGKIAYIDEAMAVYVVHRGGLWSTKRSHDHMLAIIGLFEALYKHLEPKYRGIISRILRWRYFALSEEYENVGDLAGARRSALKSIKTHLSICSDRFMHREDFQSADYLPAYIKDTRGEKLFKTLLRLYVVTRLRSTFPALYTFMRAVARELKLGL